MQKRTAGGYVALASSHQLKREEERTSLQNHHASIINAKPRLNTWNRTFVAVHEVHRNNRRTNRVEEARKMQIQKENQILIDKMAKTFLRNPSKELSPANAQTYPNSHHNPPAQHSTLNFLVRKRERDRILRDNLILAKRLIEQKPMLNAKSWQEHSNEHFRLRESLSRFADVDEETLAQARRLRQAQAYHARAHARSAAAGGNGRGRDSSPSSSSRMYSPSSTSASNANYGGAETKDYHHAYDNNATVPPPSSLPPLPSHNTHNNSSNPPNSTTTSSSHGSHGGHDDEDPEFRTGSYAAGDAHS